MLAYKPRKNAVLMLVQGDVTAGISFDTRQIWSCDKQKNCSIFRRECVALSIPNNEINKYFEPIITKPNT